MYRLKSLKIIIVSEVFVRLRKLASHPKIVFCSLCKDVDWIRLGQARTYWIRSTGL
jgi:hypothetical protein